MMNEIETALLRSVAGGQNVMSADELRARAAAQNQLSPERQAVVDQNTRADDCAFRHIFRGDLVGAALFCPKPKE